MQAHCEALEKDLCHCRQWATSELSYAEEVDQRASSPSSFLPNDSLITDVSYQLPPVEQAGAGPGRGRAAESFFQ
ncbi:MAG TPA: hypothetical protein VHV10_04675 [Ktedonobacteraceae bacterium]|nr:hypothetical protein [Ktedonobacteraceae bacterium]